MRTRTWGAGTLLALAAFGCSDDGVAPDDAVVALLTADSLVLDAVGETVQLEAGLVYASGRTSAADGTTWSGCGAPVGTVSAGGEFLSLAEGECTLVAQWGDLAASLPVRVRRLGVFTLTFDDGWKSARSVALPILSGAGLVGNVAVVPASATWPAFLSVDDMRALDAAGWAFVSHTMTHDSLPSVPDDSLLWQIEEPVRWLRDAGLRTGNVFVVPYHAWGDRERAAIRATFAGARGHAVDEFWPQWLPDWRPEDPYMLLSIDGSTLSSTAEGRARVLSYVEWAIQEGGMVDVQFHDIRPEDEPGFALLIDLLEPHADRARTWSDIYPLPES